VNQRHESVSLNAVAQHLIGILDGNHDRAAMAEHLFALTEKGTLVANRDGNRITDPDQVRTVLNAAIEQALATIAASALLVE